LPKQGGIRGALAAARIAEDAGIALSVAVYYDVLAAAAAHIAAALPAITWPSFVTRLSDSVLAPPLAPDGLLLRPPQGPGLGVTLDDEKVRRYTVER
jgi:muconate cycloisomerase